MINCRGAGVWGVNRSAVILAMIVAMLGLMAITAHADSMITGTWDSVRIGNMH